MEGDALATNDRQTDQAIASPRRANPYGASRANDPDSVQQIAIHDRAAQRGTEAAAYSDAARPFSVSVGLLMARLIPRSRAHTMAALRLCTSILL